MGPFNPWIETDYDVRPPKHLRNIGSASKKNSFLKNPSSIEHQIYFGADQSEGRDRCQSALSCRALYHQTPFTRKQDKRQYGVLYPCSTKTRDDLGNQSPTPERFPRPREISWVSGNLSGTDFPKPPKYGHSVSLIHP